MSGLHDLFGDIDIYVFDQLLRGRIAPGMRVFDAGCGSGRNLIYLLRAGYEVFGIDADPFAVQSVQRLAATLAPGLPSDNFRVEAIERHTFPEGFADVVLSSAVLHFARDDDQFMAMLLGTWKPLKRGGVMVCRLASSIGMEDQVTPVAGRRHWLPDGSERYLVDATLLTDLTRELGGEFVDPLKTTIVHNQRCMTTWVVCKMAAFILATVLSVSLAAAQTPPNTVVLRPAPNIPGVIKGGTLPEIVVRGLRAADDPLWLPNIGLVFSESAANRVVRLGADDEVTTFVGELHGPLGMTFDSRGRLISLQTQEGFRGPRVIWPAGEETILAVTFNGQTFGRPNDIVSDRNGGLYFSDLGPRPTPPGALAPAVYYVPPGGAPIRVADDISRPNGVMLSRDEKTLYVNDTGGIHAYAFDVLPDGRLANRRVFATYVGRDRTIRATDPPVANPDGLAIDDEGRVYALTEAGIEVVSASGQHLGVIPVWCITRRCQNLTFGGPDKRTLYVAGGGTLLRIPMLARGFRGRVK
jgi:gluconolactonase